MTSGEIHDFFPVILVTFQQSRREVSYMKRTFVTHRRKDLSWIGFLCISSTLAPSINRPSGHSCQIVRLDGLFSCAPCVLHLLPACYVWWPWLTWCMRWREENLTRGKPSLRSSKLLSVSTGCRRWVSHIENLSAQGGGDDRTVPGSRPKL